MNRGQSQLKQIIDQIKIEIMINIRIDQNATRTISKLSINYPDRDIVISSILLKGNGKKQERENGLSLTILLVCFWTKMGKRREKERREKKCSPSDALSYNILHNAKLEREEGEEMLSREFLLNNGEKPPMAQKRRKYY